MAQRSYDLPFGIDRGKVPADFKAFHIRIGEKMEALTNFFEAINKLLGVSTPGELLFHPVFLGICIALFIYALATG